MANILKIEKKVAVISMLAGFVEVAFHGPSLPQPPNNPAHGAAGLF